MLVRDDAHAVELELVEALAVVEPSAFRRTQHGDEALRMDGSQLRTGVGRRLRELGGELSAPEQLVDP